MRRINVLLKTIYKKPKVVKPVHKTQIILTPYEEKPLLTTQERFNNKVLFCANGCWEWQGELDRYGYGKFRCGVHILKAHRYSYELAYGEFDKSLHVLHKCDNPKCVNPAHLFLGTNQDNIADKIQKGRQKFTIHHLTITEKELIVQALREAQSKQQIAARFGISIQTVKRLSKELCV